MTKLVFKMVLKFLRQLHGFDVLFNEIPYKSFMTENCKGKGNLSQVLVSFLDEMLQHHDHVHTHTLPRRSNNSGKDLCKQLSSMLLRFSHCSK